MLTTGSILQVLCWIGVRSTNTPLIGILTLPCSEEPYNCANDPKGTSYFGASYVKWLEGGGARVIPLIADDSFANINQLLPQLNGVLITGGAAILNSESFWFNQLQNILENLRKFHDNTKQSIPLWATCLGFQGVQAVVAETNSIVVPRPAEDDSLSLNFTSAAANSRIFNSFMDSSDSQSIYQKFATQNLTYNHHKYGVSPTAYNGNHPALSSVFDILATNTDANGNTFVSLIESVDESGLYWYGSQFHPEKSQYIFDADDEENAIVHTLDAIMANQYLAEFFVNECRERNNNGMKESVYYEKVIYNYSPFYIKNGTSTYEQVYVFEKP